MARTQLRAAIALAFCVNAILWQVSESATVPPTQNSNTAANPCATISCTSPRICKVDQSNQPKCLCQLACNRMYKPVCGSNGKTYGNECMLNADACESNITVTNIFNGTCDAKLCATITCTSPRTCQVDKQSNQPKCVCLSVCNMMYQPVCGSNGKTYSNECELNGDACQTNSTITPLFNGTCEDRATGAPSTQNRTALTAKPCATITCASARICQVDQQSNQPKCVCSRACNRMSKPVCGSNGKTYNNECELNVDACDTNTTIATVFNGTCEARNSCDTVRCREGYYCQVDQTNAARCVCTDVCTDESNPVCGSDGKTYSNRCELFATSCKSGTNNTVAYQGACAQATNSTSCTGACTSDWTPVCGSDGKTYGNQCQLSLNSCTSGTNISVAHEGACVQGTDRCAAVSCTQGARCQLNDQNETRCVCNEACTKIFAQVCGSDGKTYGNQCELDKAACQSGTNISVVNPGECGKATNPCAAMLCPEGTRCQVNDVNEGRCVCNDVCNDMYAPVCGSDGKTYSNQCELDAERCMHNKKLTVVCRGTCQRSGKKLKCRSADI